MTIHIYNILYIYSVYYKYILYFFYYRISEFQYSYKCITILYVILLFIIDFYCLICKKIN